MAMETLQCAIVKKKSFALSTVLQRSKRLTVTHKFEERSDRAASPVLIFSDVRCICLKLHQESVTNNNCPHSALCTHAVLSRGLVLSSTPQYFIAVVHNKQKRFFFNLWCSDTLWNKTCKRSKNLRVSRELILITVFQLTLNTERLCQWIKLVSTLHTAQILEPWRCFSSHSLFILKLSN